MRFFLVAVMAICLPTLAYAHGGRTAADGCHRDNKNGGRHCHNGGSASSSYRVPDVTRQLTNPSTSPRPSYAAPTKARAALVEAPETEQEWNQEPSPEPVRTARTQVEYADELVDLQPITRNAYYFVHCHEMVRMGLAPMRKGGNGYRDALDFNGNGVACEEGEY